MPKKRFAEYRLEAEELNAQAQAQGQEPPIPNYSELRLQPLAKKVLQARLDLGRGVQGATSAPKARYQKSLACLTPAPNTKLLDNVIQAGGATGVSRCTRRMVKKNGLIVETRPLSKCYQYSIKLSYRSI